MADHLTLTAVPGLIAGHWTETSAATGCTAVLCAKGAVVGVDVRGGAPGTRETDAALPTTLLQRVHGVLLSGGSAFGLAAADGVMRWLEEQGGGADVGVARVPVVPAAVVFDLTVGRADVRPDAAAGYAACAAASDAPLPRGCVGAGAGAAVGHIGGAHLATKSGLGSVALRLPSGITVGAAVAVNAFGDVVDPSSGRILAGARRAPDEPGQNVFIDTAALLRTEDSRARSGPLAGHHTVIAVVGTDAEIAKTEAARIALMAHDGLARVIRPAHTMVDGDTVFVLGTGSARRRTDVTVLGSVAADVVADAIIDAVRSATSLAGLPCAADL